MLTLNTVHEQLQFCLGLIVLMSYNLLLLTNFEYCSWTVTVLSGPHCAAQKAGYLYNGLDLSKCVGDGSLSNKTDGLDFLINFLKLKLCLVNNNTIDY